MVILMTPVLLLLFRNQVLLKVKKMNMVMKSWMVILNFARSRERRFSCPLTTQEEKQRSVALWDQAHDRLIISLNFLMQV